jgi:GntR family transcriptional repressor for pyruvate dehydrogenase complex
MLKPVKHRNISDQVYEQLRDMIYQGELGPGDRLESERDLAALFRVGRPTVRNAIQRLTDQGLVESRRGVGTFVREQGRSIETSPLLQVLNNENFTIADFLEVRMALESKSAELAAQRATDEDIRRIKERIERMAGERAGQKVRIGTDISFHMNIAYASKNIVQIHLMKSLYDVQAYAMTYSYSSLLESQGIDDIIDGQHNRIFESIRSHNAESAARAMEEHISTLLNICREHGL